MLTSWRLVPSNNRHDPFTGLGAQKFGGRWNFIGTKLIYSSENRSLGMLEILANLNGLNKHRLYFLFILFTLTKKIVLYLIIKFYPKIGIALHP
ncbi:MAG: hypothetical protein C5B43_01030 [Verrucomicrobia bacterium]|nr:MAG: hypothetical protein C5B43_01030 [Verrucomicrobiota bacterium]